MTRVTTPSDYFQTLQTMGNYMTLCYRHGSYYVKRKSIPNSFSPLALLNVNQVVTSQLKAYQDMTPEEREALQETADLYYTQGINVLLALGFKSFLSSYCGASFCGASQSGGGVV